MHGDPDAPRVAVVGGAGHVGLPLALLLARSGLAVTVLDVDRDKLEGLRQGVFPFHEEGGQELLDASGDWSIDYTDQLESLTGCDIVIVTIGTPVDEHLNPRVEDVFECIDGLVPYLRDGQCMVLRSTLYPGTSRNIAAHLASQGLELGVCFCPERIAQGKALVELPGLPQIVSGTDDHATGVATLLFSRLTEEIVQVSLEEAELAKLFCNAWRYVAFAVANQFYNIAAEHDLDFDVIRDALQYKYERAADLPRSGFAAGPCLFKDTMQLAAYSSRDFSLGYDAMVTNETLPERLVERARRSTPLSGRRVGILGMAFKPNNDDKRESLAYRLRKNLRREGAEVLCTDTYIQDPEFVSPEKLLAECDVIFVGCPHREYQRLDLSDKTVIDCWGFVRSSAPGDPGPSLEVPGLRKSARATRFRDFNTARAASFTVGEQN